MLVIGESRYRVCEFFVLFLQFFSKFEVIRDKGDLLFPLFKTHSEVPSCYWIWTAIYLEQYFSQQSQDRNNF